MPLTAEQLAERRTGVGGSDAAAVCGVDPFRSPYELYLDKIGELPEFTGNEATKWGDYLEPAVRQEYAEQTGRIVRMPPGTCRHPEHSFLLAHPDGVTEDGRLYEGKTTRYHHDWGAPGSNEVPDRHYLQCQHNMMVLGLEVADLVVLIAGQDWRMYEIPADAGLQQMMLEEESAFWERVILRDPPELATARDVQMRYGAVKAGGGIEADEDVLATVEHLVELERKAAHIKDAITDAKTLIQKYLGEHERLLHNGRVIATWSTVQGRSTLDATALHKAHPAIYDEFERTGKPYRRFQLKEKKA